MKQSRFSLPQSLRLCVIIGLIFSLTGCAVSANSAKAQALESTASQTGKTTGSADQMLEALFDAEWQRDLANNPVGASMLGDKRYNHRWPDLSLENLAQNRAKDQATLDQLANIKREQLSAANRLNYDLFKQGYVDRLKESRFERYLIPLNQRGGIQTQDTMLDSLRFSNKKDYLDWIARLESFPNYMQQTIDLMKAGQTKNILPPKVIMQRIPDQIQLQLVDSPEESGFYKPFKNKPDFIKPSEWKSLQSRAAANIQAGVIPAYKKFHAFINNEYLPACRDTVGVWDSPDGQAFYQQRVKRFTTTELSYDEIHQIGLSEVKRIRSEMQKIIDDLEFDGSFNDFLTFLRTDKQFYYATPEELETAYLATSKRIDPELVKLFGKLPRMPYGIKKIPDSIAPDTTTAYYSRPAADGSRAGFYYVNLYKPETRPKYEIEVLSVHEAMPGHHLQIALAMELGDLPNFRKLGGFTAFVEGWGLYSESLGGDLGLYKDPYSKFGQLTYEMWRAVRLVVDTGMHAKQWTRQQAIDFFKANAAKTEHDIVNEIDRYIAWPGQALAYKIGELKIKELRARAEKQLGEDFDVREFHDLVLSQGAIPLNILENTIDAWLANK